MVVRIYKHAPWACCTKELIGMAPAIGEEVAPPVEKKAAPRPYSQQLLITESLRWAPTLTTRHWQPQQSHFDAPWKKQKLLEGWRWQMTGSQKQDYSEWFDQNIISMKEIMYIT